MLVVDGFGGGEVSLEGMVVGRKMDNRHTWWIFSVNFDGFSQTGDSQQQYPLCGVVWYGGFAVIVDGCEGVQIFVEAMAVG